jgi:hypothetical protein
VSNDQDKSRLGTLSSGVEEREREGQGEAEGKK